MTNDVRSHRARWLWLAVVLGALMLVGAACANGDSSTGPEPTDLSGEAPGADASNASNEPGEIDVKGGDEPLFVYTGADELGGEEVTLVEVFELGKPVVLNFWAGLCAPCRREMPDFQATYEELGDQFTLLGVDVGPFTGLGNQNDALDLLEDLEITYPTAYVDGDKLIRAYNIFGMPTTVFMTPDGKIVSAESGFMSGSEIRERTLEMIDASG